MSFSTYLNNISDETRMVVGAYIVLASIYLIIGPLLLYWWMNNRWYVMGKFERLGVYGLVFLFFPGLIILSPFLNMRLKGQGDD